MSQIAKGRPPQFMKPGKKLAAFSQSFESLPGIQSGQVKGKVPFKASQFRKGSSFKVQVTVHIHRVLNLPSEEFVAVCWQRGTRSGVTSRVLSKDKVASWTDEKIQFVSTLFKGSDEGEFEGKDLILKVKTPGTKGRLTNKGKVEVDLSTVINGETGQKAEAIFSKKLVRANGVKSRVKLELKVVAEITQKVEEESLSKVALSIASPRRSRRAKGKQHSHASCSNGSVASKAGYQEKKQQEEENSAEPEKKEEASADPPAVQRTLFSGSKSGNGSLLRKSAAGSKKKQRRSKNGKTKEMTVKEKEQHDESDKEDEGESPHSTQTSHKGDEEKKQDSSRNSKQTGTETDLVSYTDDIGNGKRIDLVDDSDSNYPANDKVEPQPGKKHKKPKPKREIRRRDMLSSSVGSRTAGVHSSGRVSRRHQKHHSDKDNKAATGIDTTDVSVPRVPLSSARNQASLLTTDTTAMTKKKKTRVAKQQQKANEKGREEEKERETCVSKVRPPPSAPVQANEPDTRKQRKHRRSISVQAKPSIIADTQKLQGPAACSSGESATLLLKAPGTPGRRRRRPKASAVLLDLEKVKKQQADSGDYLSAPKQRENSQQPKKEQMTKKIEKEEQNRREDVQFLVNDVIYFMEPTYSQGVSVSAYVIFRSLLQWRAFDQSNRHTLHAVSDALAGVLRRASKDISSDTDILCYWISSCAALLHMIRTQLKVVARGGYRGPLGPPEETLRAPGGEETIRRFEHTLVSLVETGCSSLANAILTAIETLVVPAVLQQQPSLAHSGEEAKAVAVTKPAEVTKELSAYLSHCRNAYMPTGVCDFLFAIVAYNITANVANALLFNESFCRCANGFQIKMATTHMEEWFASNRLPAAKDQLRLVRQIADVLVVPKTILADRTTRADLCPGLTPSQLLKILRMYKPDDFDSEAVDPSVIEALEAEEHETGAKDVVLPAQLSAGVAAGGSASDTSATAIGNVPWLNHENSGEITAASTDLETIAVPEFVVSRPSFSFLLSGNERMSRDSEKW